MKISEQMDSYGRFPAAGEVVFIRRLPGPIERVWAYITEPEKRAKWLAGGDIDLRTGGSIELNFTHANLSAPIETIPEKYRKLAEEGCSFTGRILECEPPRLLRHLWGDNSEVSFELSEIGEQVELVLRHVRLDDHDTAVSVSAGWHTHLAIMEATLKGETPPLFWGMHTRLEAEYEERLRR